ncbi:hypothetical protein Hamer_G015919 [Homarus americanus]|uniref:Uncharacterized protein n=1 Tax=Homarus americanus TaxID=6706 RepID=A0A8J5MMV7_HOMAM|nr:hypothetical protein Hamer_G015919 [Homarus americanus]
MLPPGSTFDNVFPWLSYECDDSDHFSKAKMKIVSYPHVLQLLPCFPVIAAGHVMACGGERHLALRVIASAWGPTPAYKATPVMLLPLTAFLLRHL